MPDSTGVIAVLRASSADVYGPVVRTLAEVGIAIELTLTTPGTIAALPGLRCALPSDALLGVGTVLSAADARAAVEAGAQFIVTPTANPEVIDIALAEGLEVYPGAFTPTEAHLNWSRGATAVKLFPASVVGPSYIAHLRGPFPEIRIVPSGGVGLDSIGEWIRAGASAVSLGGPLLGDALAGGSLEALARRAASAVASVAAARAAL